MVVGPRPRRETRRWGVGEGGRRGRGGREAAARRADANDCRSLTGGFDSFGGSSYSGAGGYTQSPGGFGSPTASQAEKKSVGGEAAPWSFAFSRSRGRTGFRPGGCRARTCLPGPATRKDALAAKCPCRQPRGHGWSHQIPEAQESAMFTTGFGFFPVAH